MTSLEQEANLLGAIALALADVSTAAAANAAGQSASGSAALSAIYHFLGEPSIDQLGRVLGLSQSGAVRLVDRLEAAGLVARGPGRDARSRSVSLTPGGVRAARRATRAREDVLREALAGLNETERSTLHDLLGKVTSAVVDAKQGGAWICRLCDVTACRRNAGECPVASAAVRKYGA